MTTTSSISWFVRLLVLLSVPAVLVAAHTVQGQGAAVRLEVPRGQVEMDEQPFTVDVLVDDVVNLGALQIELAYDPQVVELQDIHEGPFLGSSGREVQCLPPDAEVGALIFRCVTLGATPDGPTGSGILATLTFQPVGAGISTLHFDRVILTDPSANRLPVETQDSSVSVREPEGGGIRWMLWGPVIGGAAIVLVVGATGAWYARRRLG